MYGVMCQRRHFFPIFNNERRSTMNTTGRKRRRTYTPSEKARRRLGAGGAGGNLRKDSVSPAKLPVVNRFYSGPSSSSRLSNKVSMPIANASYFSSTSSDSNYSSDLLRYSSEYSSCSSNKRVFRLIIYIMFILVKLARLVPY